MATKAAFLSKIRSALGVSAEREIEPDVASQIVKGPDSVSAEATRARRHALKDHRKLTNEMATAAADIGWIVHRRSTPAEAADAVVEICHSEGVRTAARSEHDVFTRVPVDSAMAPTGIELTKATREPDSDAAEDLGRRLALRTRMFNIDAGITGVDHAVAETGTVVINPRQGVSRLSSVAPPIHIAIMEAGQVLPSLDELFLLTRDDFLEGRHRGMVNLMTGPSRTADIEATLVTGVHGPLQVHLVIIG